MAKTLRIEVSTDHNPDAVPVDGQYIVAFIRKQLLAGEVYPENLRYNPTTHAVEYTPDGGTTWVPAPGSDPRNTTTKPPLSGTNAACNSASSEVAYLVKFLNLLYDGINIGGTAFQLGTGLINLLVELGPWGILLDVAVALTTVAKVFGLPAISELLDPDSLELIRCVLNCHLKANNQIDANALTGIENDLAGLFTSNAATIINGLLSLQGVGGINDAMALNLDPGEDCTTCAGCTWCYSFVPAGTFGEDWVPQTPGRSVFDGTKWTGGTPTSGTKGTDIFSVNFPATFISRIEVNYTITDNDGGRPAIILYNGATQVYRFDQTANGTHSNQSGVTLGVNPGVTATSIRIAALGLNTPGSGNGAINNIVVKGTGSNNPFGGTNC